MTKYEIKEIIDDMKEVAEYSTASNLVRELDSKDCKILLDYITNLQNQLEEKTYLYNKLDTESKYTIIDLQSRIDKANQLIEKQKKKMYKSRNKIAMYILMNLENILRGDE